MNIGIGDYRPKDYPKIYKMSEDKDNMNRTWVEWKKKRDDLKASLEMQGLQTIDILVIPSELKKYCEAHGFKIDGEARSKFVRHKVLQLNN